MNGTESSRAGLLSLLVAMLLPVLVLFKRVPAEVTVGLVVVIGIAWSVRRRHFDWLRQGWLLAGIALSLILLGLSFFSVHPLDSALSAVLALRWPVYAALLVWWFTAAPKRLDYFERSVVAVVAFIIIDTVIQYVFGHDVFGLPPSSPTRLTGPFDHPLVGTFTARFWFIALAVAWFAAWRIRALAALAVLAGMTVVGALFLFLTGERAALLTYLLGSAVVLAGDLRHYRAWRWPLVGLMLALGILAGAVAVTQKEMVQRSVDSTVATITHLGDTVYGLNFETGFAEFSAHPWTGVGARQFKAYCDTELPAYKARYDAMGFEGAVIHPHNFYSGMLAEGGIFAFLALVVMVGALFWRIFGSADAAKQPMQAYFAAAMLLVTFWPIQSTMEYFNGWTAAVIWTGVAWALARARVPHE